MRPKLIASALPSATLAWTIAARRDTPAGNKDSSHQIRHRSSLASGVMALQSRTWASRSSLVVRKDQNKCGEGKEYQWYWDLNKKEDCDPWGEDEPNPTSAPTPGCDGKPCESSSHIPSPTSPTTISTLQGTPSPTSSSTTTSVSSSAQGSPTATVTVTNTPATTSASMSDNDLDGIHQNEHSEVSKPVIAAGVVGGLLFLFILLLAYYWLVIRPRRRNRLSEQNPALSKDADLESHVTVDLRNGIQTPPHDPNSSSDGISSFALSAVPGSPGLGHHVVVASAARSLSMPSTPPLPHAGVYPALQRGPMASSPAVNHLSAAAYAVPRGAYSQAHLPQTYSPMGSPQAPVFPPINHPPPLHIGAMVSRAAPSPSPPMELDSRPPPPRYPGAIETSELSPTSPLPVSPLSTTSPHETAAAAALAGNTTNSSNTISAVSVEESSQHHSGQQQPQRYNGLPRPSYEGYEAAALPEVVSPICQLGQTSASLPEYDESAEAIARSGGVNSSQQHSNGDSFTSHHFPYLRHESDEKQALQQSMSRY
ncbi:hypothetical protein GGR55DRAFT_15729 [Xylaria sp. FL0064]|nr:hypothetical protein GGR55DRAFT_15729 [Xylaria sp. FL0064]